LCPFESGVIGVGPQVGYVLPLGQVQAYINLKAYGEFAAHDRPSGWNAWLTLSFSPLPPTKPAIGNADEMIMAKPYHCQATRQGADQLGCKPFAPFCHSFSQ